MGEVEEARQAPTMQDLCDRYMKDHFVKLRPSSQRDCLMYIKNDILPTMRHAKVAEVSHADVDRLHAKVSQRAPYVANRVHSLLSKMFNLAIRWGWRDDNPCRGVERNAEVKRQKFLNGDQIERIKAELERFEDRQAADIISLLMLTGARSKEVFSMMWSQVDLDKGVWVKPIATTKTAREHRVPLSEDACEIIARQKRTALFVFPGDGRLGHRESVRKPWLKVCQRAGLEDVRIHDLRHSFASLLASSGLSLPIIGEMLGHTQSTTTHRYAHLMDEPLRAAAELAAAGIRKPRPGKVVRLKP
jgi:integrase